MVEEPAEGWCFVVDDDEAFRASMLALLAGRGFSCREFSSARAFRAAIDALEPGVVLLDQRMPEAGGIELLDEAGEELARFAVIMLSGQGDIAQAVRAIKAGAVEFLEKPVDAAMLLARIVAAQRSLGERLADQSERHDAAALVDGLTPREHEVLRGLLSGSPNKTIARTLELSVRTVEMHRARMLAKLGAKSTAEAVRLAMQAKVQRW